MKKALSRAGAAAKKILSKWGVLIVILLLIAWNFIPRPLVGDPDNSEILSVFYRADSWEVLHAFYPNPISSINQGELLRLLNESSAVHQIYFPTNVGRTYPQGDVTLQIWVSDGNDSKTILLGEINELSIDSSYGKYYTILNAESVLEEALEILNIDEDADLTMLPPVASNRW